MTIPGADQYFKILGVEEGAGIDQIKKAYRKKARLYHPDLNKRKEAAEIFIAVNEAYEYLTERARLANKNGDSRAEMTRAWHEYRREQSRMRAKQYTKERFSEFTRSDIYKTSAVLNKLLLYISFSVSIFILAMAIVGYTVELESMKKGHEPPSLIAFIFLLIPGVIFFVVSLAHLLAFYDQKRKIESYEKSNK